MTTVSAHQIHVEEKQGESSRLYRWACSCGEGGPVWYSRELALRNGFDHTQRAA